PTYTLDIAERLHHMLEAAVPSGLYHVANARRASLWELMTTAFAQTGLQPKAHRVSHQTFPATARKNVNTPIISVKQPPLRSWQDALASYCAEYHRDS